MTLAQAIAEWLPSEDEMLLMAAEAVFPPPSILDPPERQQGLWDGLAMTKGYLEALPMDEWPHFKEDDRGRD